MKILPTVELPHHLMEMGSKLKNPPKDLSKRSELLDAVEGLLSRVAQSPSFPVCHALLPTKEALIAERFFGSSDMSVKVSSLSCIHELIRISCPVQPYEDDRMKEIFKETVKAFEHLSSGSGRCFQKARSILYNVANVRSGLLLLDLGCESLVAQLFQIFLQDTRSDYPAEVVSDMENLMTQLIMEADKMSVDMLRPLVMRIGAENEVKSPPSAVLGMKVLQNCSTTVQPFLQTVIQQLKQDLESCSNAVSALLPKDNVRKRSLPRKLAEYYVLTVYPRRKKRERCTRSVEENVARDSRIKVWWPADKQYYEGTVSTYDRSRKRHRVVYADGDEESLRLSRERWSFVYGRSTIQEGNQEPNPPDASSSDASNPPDASSSDVPVDEPNTETYRRVQCCSVVVLD